MTTSSNCSNSVTEVDGIVVVVVIAQTRTVVVRRLLLEEDPCINNIELDSNKKDEAKPNRKSFSSPQKCG
jgi:hypothetical protein